MLSSGRLAGRLFGRLKTFLMVMSRGIYHVLTAGLYITRRTLGFVGVGSRRVWHGLARGWEQGPGQWIDVMLDKMN